ncbi:SLC13 family permease [Streptomyces spiralis]
MHAGIDWNVIFLLMGMMMIVGVLKKSGLFEYLAIWTVKRARAKLFRVMVMLVVITAVASALLDNVTTVLLIARVTLLVCERLALSAAPFLIAEVMASNIGGIAPLVGDPPNIIIASRAGLAFNDSVVHLAPLAAVRHRPRRGALPQAGGAHRWPRAGRLDDAARRVGRAVGHRRQHPLGRHNSPITAGLVHDMGGTSNHVMWWALALGADLGGNATAIGASANVVVLGIAERNRQPISYWQFTKYGLIVTAITVGISAAYMWLRYFALS